MMLARLRKSYTLKPISVAHFSPALHMRRLFPQVFFPTHFTEKNQDAPRIKHKVRYDFSDPLHLQKSHEKLYGGFELYVEHVKQRRLYNCPINSVAYILYHAAQRDINDPVLYKNLEKSIPYGPYSVLVPREMFGALYAYYKSGLGDLEYMHYFEKSVEQNLDKIMITEVMDLIESLSFNPRLSRGYILYKIDSVYKPKLVENLKKTFYRQKKYTLRFLKLMMKLEYYDTDMWNPLLDLLMLMNKFPSDMDLFDTYERLIELNNNRCCPFYGRLANLIWRLKFKITRWGKDWRYDPNECRPKTFEEMAQRTENLTFEESHKLVRLEKYQGYEKAKPERETKVIPPRLIPPPGTKTPKEFTEEQKKELEKFANSPMICDGKLTELEDKFDEFQKMINNVDETDYDMNWDAKLFNNDSQIASSQNEVDQLEKGDKEEKGSQEEDRSSNSSIQSQETEQVNNQISPIPEIDFSLKTEESRKRRKRIRSALRGKFKKYIQ